MSVIFDSENEKRVYDAIESFVAKNRHWPIKKDIHTLCGLSYPALNLHLNTLADKGVIELPENKGGTVALKGEK